MVYFRFFFFNDTATTEIYTLSLHDALPISTTATAHPDLDGPTRSPAGPVCQAGPMAAVEQKSGHRTAAHGYYQGHSVHAAPGDRKSTRLNSSHANISYAVFCLKKKK